MRSSVIAAITTTATTIGRREAADGRVAMSGAVVTAALFPDLRERVNDTAVRMGTAAGPCGRLPRT
jgi:hypothetical protein